MCGIFGIINKVEAPFDYSTFCVLGINNDSRGGDSCGVFIDQEVEYGVDKEKLFKSEKSSTFEKAFEFKDNSAILFEFKLSTY